MKNYLKAFTAAALAIAATAASLPATAADVRVGINVGAPVYAQPRAYYGPAPVVRYGPPRVISPGYYGARYDYRARRDAEWRHREWLRHEQLRREEWRRQQWRREHWRNDRGWHGR